MKWKIVVTYGIVGVLAFGLGWLLRDLKNTNTSEANENDADCAQKSITITPQQLDSIITAANTHEKDGNFTFKRSDSLRKAVIAQQKQDQIKNRSNGTDTTGNFSRKLTGRFIMTESSCAGFNFISSSHVTWTNEIQCNAPDTLKLHWIDERTFFTQDIQRVKKGCPPNNRIYQVISFTNGHLVLKEIWTGWNTFEDETIEFIQSPDGE